MQWYGYLLIVLAVLVLAGLALVAPRLRRRALPPAPPAPERIPEAAPQVPVTPVEEAPPVAEAPTAQAPVLERPEPTAGRLVRLRARLARSQSSVGSALLNLLSRDKLDDDTWDEIEEVLITADVGVVPARLMVDELKTKVKVLGTRSPDDVRRLLKAELLTQLDGGMDR